VVLVHLLVAFTVHSDILGKEDDAPPPNWHFNTPRPSLRQGCEGMGYFNKGRGRVI
jgi:hypothetical protein